MTESPLLDTCLVVPVFSPSEDLIACLDKAMAFLTAVASSMFPSTNNQLRTSSNARNQATIQDSMVIVQQVQGRQRQSYYGTGYKSNATSSGGNNASGHARVVKCYNSQGPRVPGGQAIQSIIPNNTAFLTEDLDTYDSDIDDISNAKAVLMDNISSYGSDVISEVPHSETYLNDMENQSVHAMQDFEQTLVKDLTDNEITKKLALKEQVDSLEQNLSKQIKEKESLLKTFTVFKNESKEKENKYMENEIDLAKKINELDNIIFKVGGSIRSNSAHVNKASSFYDNIYKQAIGYQNPFYLKKAQWIKPTLYDGIIISNKHVAMPVIDDEETLILEEVSRSKMSEKEKDLEAIKQKISHKPINYVKLNKLYEDFGKHFVPQQELSTDEVFWYHMLNHSTKSSDALPVKIEAPKELPEVSLVNEILKKLKLHLANFDKVVKIRTIPNARIEDIYNVFNKDILNETIELQIVFDQMDAVVQQSSVNKQCLEIAKKELLLENDRLLQQIMSQDVLLTVMNSMSLNGKEIVDIIAQKPSANTIVLGIFKLDLDPLTPKLLKNREAHIDYFKYTQKQADILQGMVKQGLKCSTSNFRSKPIRNKKNDIISETPSRNMKNKVEAQPRKFNKRNHVVKPIRDVDVKKSQLNTNSELICATCTVRFKNDHIARIMGYGDYQRGKLSHLNFGTLNELAKDGLARGILRLKFQKDHMCSASALGKSKKSSHQPKAKDTNQEKLYLLHMDLCGPMRVASINGKSSGLGLHSMTPATSSLGLVSNHVSQQSYIPPNIDAWDRLFQPMFNEYFNPLTIVVSSVPVAAAQRAIDLADSPVSTSIDQDAPSTKPKNFKQAMTEPSWIDAMQEEIHEFERLQQLWATAKVNIVNGEEQIRAQVDKKKVIVTKISLTLIGYANLTQKLTFYKAFFSPQWKFFIPTIQQCLSAKTTSWNEFSSTMASTIIYLGTNQKFNFSKYIFDNMVKNLEGGVKFLMFLRFVQVFLDKQVEGMFKHKEIYVTPSHTKKVFAIIKRQGKDFFGRVTPLFPTIIVQAQEELDTSIPTEVVADEAVYEEMYNSVERAATTATGLDAEQDRDSGPRRQETMRDAAAQTRSERVSKFSNDPPLLRVNTLESGEDRLKLTELIELCVLDDEEVVAKKEVTTAGEVVTTLGVEVSAASTTPTFSMDDNTLAKALVALKSAKPMLKNKSFKEVQKDFDNTMSWINSFVLMDKEVIEGSSKRAREELESDKSKKKNLDEKVEVEEDNDQEEAKMKMYMKIVPDDEIEIDVITLATKPPIIID
nr:ribonuclease H-like domain-containing protein [Tanacetum cinerariifolium]